jgi:type I restriction enzyme S subunit
VPAHWRVVRLKTTFGIRKHIAGYVGPDVLSVTQRGLKKKDLTSGDGQLSMDYSKYQIVSVGDFVMNHMDLLTGFVDIARQGGVTSPDYRVFLPRTPSAVAPRYFLYIFQLCYANRIFFPLGQGSAQLGRWRLPRRPFEEFLLPTPEIEEQTQIAAFLDYETARIDTLIDTQEQLIALLKEKRQAVIRHAVTKGLNPDAPMRDSGVEWLGEVPAHWEVVRLKHVTGFTTSGPRGWSDLITESGEDLFLQSGDLDYKLGLRLDSAKRISPPRNAEGVRTRMRDGDVVVCITGANTGRVAVAEALHEAVYVNQHLSLVRPLQHRVAPRFLATILASSPIRTYFAVKQYGLKEGLSLTNVAEAPLCVPPIDEQAIVIDYLRGVEERLDGLERAANAQVELLRERRTALISAAVTGKIDVRNWKPPASVDPTPGREVA